MLVENGCVYFVNVLSSFENVPPLLSSRVNIATFDSQFMTFSIKFNPKISTLLFLLKKEKGKLYPLRHPTGQSSLGELLYSDDVSLMNVSV